MMATTDRADDDTRQTGRALRATVVESLPNAMFRLRKEDGTELLAHVAGALRMQFTRLLPGDLVDVEESPFDRGKARILRLQQNGRAPSTGPTRSNPTQDESKP